jgi:hypothetical protein
MICPQQCSPFIKKNSIIHLTAYLLILILSWMWKVYRTDEFKEWFDNLDFEAKEPILKDIIILSNYGPSLSRPYVDTLKGSKLNNLKELRTKFKNNYFRIIFAFDPERDIILLVGGNKSNDKNFYSKIISKAEKIFLKHIDDIQRIKNED